MMLIFIALLLNVKLIAQNNNGLVHGPIISASYENKYDFVGGVGYHFRWFPRLVDCNSDEVLLCGFLGWQATLMLEATTGNPSLGIIASGSYRIFGLRLGSDLGYRTNSMYNNRDFIINDIFISPNIGFDIIIFELSVGPSFHLEKNLGNYVGIRVGLKFKLPYFWTKGANNKLKTLNDIFREAKKN